MSTTQYLLGVHHGDEISWPEGVTADQVMADVDAFNGKLREQGRSRDALDAALALDPTALERAHLERLRAQR